MSETLSQDLGSTGSAGETVDAAESTASTEFENNDPKSSLSRAEEAINRVEQSRSKATDEPDSQQALKGEKSGEESTEDESSKSASEEKPEADGENSDADTSDSTVTAAPEDWPENLKQAFDALGSDEAKEAMIEVYGDMNKGFNKAMSNLAQLKKGYEGMFESMEKYSADQHEVVRLLDLDAEFNNDPKAVIQRLAALSDTTIYFDQPATNDDGEPEFKSTAELIEHTKNSTIAAMEAKRDKEARAAQAEKELEDNKAKLRQEFSDAESNHPDFAEVKDKIIHRLSENPYLPVEDAYQLERLPTLQKLAKEGQEAKAELEALKATIEKQKKDTTKVQGHDANAGEQIQSNRGKSKAEIALDKVAAKKQQQ